MSKVMNPKIPRFPDYSQNCGQCMKCTMPNFNNLNRPKCPVCGSELAKLRIFNNPCNNWVTCENGHDYDILNFCDSKDIGLHQRTIRRIQGFKE